MKEIEESANPSAPIIAIIKKIKNDILLFGIASISIFGLAVNNTDLSVGITFVLLYVITLTFYLWDKGIKTKKVIQKSAKRDEFNINMVFPEAIPLPNVCRIHGVNIIELPIKFNVENKSATESYKVTIDVLSESQAVDFALDSPSKFSKLSLIFRHESNVSRKQTIKTTLQPKTSEILCFHGNLIPKKSVKDYNLKGSVLIKYRFHAINLQKNTWFDSGVKRLEIPFKENVEYNLTRILS